MKTRKISIKRIFLSLAYATLNNLWSEWRTIGSTSGEVRHSIVILTRSYPLTYWPCLLIEEEVATLKRKISRVFRFLSILSSILKGFFRNEQLWLFFTNKRASKEIELDETPMKGETTDITDLQVVRGELRAVAFLSSIVAEERLIV